MTTSEAPKRLPPYWLGIAGGVLGAIVCLHGFWSIWRAWHGPAGGFFIVFTFGGALLIVPIGLLLFGLILSVRTLSDAVRRRLSPSGTILGIGLAIAAVSLAFKAARNGGHGLPYLSLVVLAALVNLSAAALSVRERLRATAKSKSTKAQP